MAPEPELSVQVATELPIPLQDVFGDEPMMAVATELPSSFAGFWYGESAEVVVGLTNPADLERAIPLIQPWLSDFHSGGYVAQQMDQPFALLAAYRTMLRQDVFDIDGVVSLGVRESEDRVVIGITDPETESAVRSLLAQMAIPSGLVLTPVVPEPVSHAASAPVASASGLDLQDKEPDGEIQAGWQVRRSDGGICTLGFTALDPSDSYAEVFVTNSHCTTTSPGFDGGTIYQPDVTQANAVGTEEDDPSSTCGSDCREADVALISADVDMKFETIAKTTERETCDQCPAELTIDMLDSAFEVVGEIAHTIENETLEKVGRTTGWTGGGVEDTCTDYEIEGWVRSCSDRVDYSARVGDSGSPVFSLTSGGDAEIRGVHFGWQGCGIVCWNDALMSDTYQIELDLGDLVVYEPTTNATILGPDEVPAFAACNWEGSPQGRPPFSYEWRKDGALVATTKNYDTSNTGSSDFQLSFRVTDARSTTSTDYLSVTIDPNDFGITCSW